jgi:hypothetical protein
VGSFVIVAWGVRGGVIGWWSHLQACRRRRSHHPHLHGIIRWSLLLAWERRSGAAAARASHLLHTRGRRSYVAVGQASHLLAWRRSSVAWERNEPPVAISACLFARSECLLIMAARINVKKGATYLAILQNKSIHCNIHSSIHMHETGTHVHINRYTWNKNTYSHT